MHDRDPRIDPRPGDAVLSNTFRREVRFIRSDIPGVLWVEYIIQERPGLRLELLNDWKKSKKRGEVLHAAD